MLKKFIIAAAALSAVVTFASMPAKADPRVSIGIGFGFGGDFGPNYGSGYGPGYGIYDDGFDQGYRPHHRRRHFQNTYYSSVSCSGGANLLRRAGFRGVEADDCSAPVYSYQAWKHGQQFDIQVSSRGRIISVDPAY